MVEAIVGAILGAILGTVLGALVTWAIERRKARIEGDRQRAKTAYDACQRLHELLGDWYTEISKATKFEQSTEKTINKLVEFMEQVHFDTRIKSQINLIRPEPLCGELIEKTYAFQISAYKQKNAVTGGEIKIGFQKHFNRKDYDKCRDEALFFLKRELKPFEDELNRITPLLQQMARAAQ
jgi:hypothetical protein